MCNTLAFALCPPELRIPPGFEAILDGFCRQVLKEQPEQIVHFAAEYFAAKLEARNGEFDDDCFVSHVVKVQIELASAAWFSSHFVKTVSHKL